MKRRLITVILFAVLAAAGSSTILFRVVSSGKPRAVGTTTTVLVAARNLNAGALIGNDDVRPAQWPSGSGSTWLGRREDVVGRGLLTAIQKDEPFAESRLAERGAGAGLAARIPPGMRAIAVHVDELTGLSRFIFAGMHVDVISTGDPGHGVVSRTILQNVEVFSTGQEMDRDGKEKPAGAPVFNLLVTPQDAEILSQAVAQTRVALVLRNPLDKVKFLPAPEPAHVSVNATPKTASARPKHQEPPPPAVISAAPAQEPPPTVEVIHGLKRTVNIVGPAAGPEAKL